VGVIRLLRVGSTLLKESDGSYTLNLTQMKQHTTSRFTGPSISSLTPLISVQLNEMLTQIEYDNVALCDKPYLWHVQSDCSRPVSSSAFTKMVKDAFQRHAGKATPPKVLRSIFITVRALDSNLPTHTGVALSLGSSLHVAVAAIEHGCARGAQGGRSVLEARHRHPS
jgi:hypothetical protein